MAMLAEKRVDHDVEEHFEQTAARPEELRLLEALLFASAEPLDQAALAKRMPDGVDVRKALAQLQDDYAMRGVNLVRVGSKWTFRTAADLAWLMTRETTETRKLSRAAIEVLAIIAYHQPVTRAEIEEIRGVVTSKGTLDVLLETGWIRPRGRRKTPGRPLTFGTTDGFLAQFSLEALSDLPGLDELKGTGLLDPRLPAGFNIPAPSDDPALREDEDPLEPGDLELTLAPAVEPDSGLESQHAQAGPEAAELAEAGAVSALEVESEGEAGAAALPEAEFAIEAEEIDEPAVDAEAADNVTAEADDIADDGADVVALVAETDEDEAVVAGEDGQAEDAEPVEQAGPTDDSER